MKKYLLAIFLVMLISTQAFAVPGALLLTFVKEPVAVTALEGYTKEGTSHAFGLFWLLAFGDAGTDSAAKSAGIKAIHHVDKEYINLFFGLLVRETTIVYGK